MESTDGKDNVNKNLPINVNLKSISRDEIVTEFGKNRKSFDKSDINYITQKHFEDFSSDYEKLSDYVFKLIFYSFPDEKQDYDSKIECIRSIINKLQKANLSICQLKNEIKNKENVEREIKEKEGEQTDYNNRIKDLENKSEISEDVKKISTDLFDAKNKKQKVERMLCKISSIKSAIDNFNKLEDLLNDFNHDLEVDLPSSETFPVENIRSLLENINTFCTFQVFHFNQQLYKLNLIPTHWPLINTSFVLIPCYLITFALPLCCIAYAKLKNLETTEHVL